MAESEVKLSEYRRTVVCECGVELDLRTQGLLCATCRAKFRMERRSRMAAAWERFHRRHSRPYHSDGPSAVVEGLIDAIDSLVAALDRGRSEGRRERWPSTSLVLPSIRSSESRRAPGGRPSGGGIPVDRLEWE